MKTKIHPNYKHDVTVSCACGNTFTTGSIVQSIQVDICSACHPFYTGEMRFVDTQGRVEKFQNKMQKVPANYQSKKQRLQAKRSGENEPSTPQTLKEMIESQQKKAQA